MPSGNYILKTRRSYSPAGQALLTVILALGLGLLLPPEAGSTPEAKLSVPTALPEVLQDDLEKTSLIKVIKNQLKVMKNVKDLPPVPLGTLTVTREQLKETLEDFLKLLEADYSLADLSRKIKEQYVFYEAGKGGDKQFFFTGYYTPVIHASRFQTDKYRFPLYYLPDNILKVNLIARKPHKDKMGYLFHSLYRANNFTREDIDEQRALIDRHLEIAWLADDIERFFLHIQGSGVLSYINGTTESVHYLGSNGYPYRSIGKQMLKDGVIGPGQSTMQGIKNYLRNHPRQRNKYLYQNKRYIFFKLTDTKPKGYGGGEVVAHRSIATDKAIYPSGGLAFIQAKKPVLNENGKVVRWEPFTRFVVDQDTGNAIRGPGRADLYFGVGPRAGEAAGVYKMKAKVFYLLKK